MLWWILRQLDSNDPEKKIRAAEKLGDMKETRAVELLLKALSYDHIFVQAAAARALGKIGDDRAIGPLIDVLQKYGDEQSIAAAWALGEMRANGAIETLRAALDPRGYAGVRWAAAEALERMNWIPETEKDRALVAIATHRWEEVAYMGDLAVELLGEVLATGVSSDSQLPIVRALGATRNPKAIQPLATIVAKHIPTFSRKDLLNEAVQGLLKIGHPDVVDALLEQLRDEKGDLRETVIKTLVKIGDARAAPALAEAALNSPTLYGRRTAVWAAARLGGIQTLKMLIGAIHDSNREVRNAAEKALKNLRLPEANEVLKEYYTIPHRQYEQGETVYCEKCGDKMRVKYAGTANAYEIDRDLPSALQCEGCGYIVCKKCSTITGINICPECEEQKAPYFFTK